MNAPAAPPGRPHDARPLLFLTPGDPAGVGPEILLAAWNRAEAHAGARLRVCASPALLDAVLAAVPSLPRLRIETIGEGDGRPSTADTVLVVPVPHVGPVPRRGTVSAAGGRMAVAALERAFASMRCAEAAGGPAAIVTGPLHKEALHAAGYDVPGHTEWLARACGLDDGAASMMLWLPPGGAGGGSGLGVVHVTLHEPLAAAVARLSTRAIVAAGERLDALLGALLGRRPRIAVAALNPHGGEGGLFGDEETRLIAPAVERMRDEGIDAVGPLPADTLFLRAAGGAFDGVVAQYHDQGHIPVKLLGMHRAVNVTLGLPLVRTSVAHGTAFDIVGTGHADPSSLGSAIDAAARLAAHGWRGGVRGAGGAPGECSSR